MLATCAMGLNGLAGPLARWALRSPVEPVVVCLSPHAHTTPFFHLNKSSLFFMVHSLDHIVKIQIFHNNIYLLNHILNFATIP
jgi:hypothetical protein